METNEYASFMLQTEIRPHVLHLSVLSCPVLLCFDMYLPILSFVILSYLQHKIRAGAPDLDKPPQWDPTIVASAYKKQRLYLFTRREPADAEDATVSAAAPGCIRMFHTNPHVPV